MSYKCESCQDGELLKCNECCLSFRHKQHCHKCKEPNCDNENAQGLTFKDIEEVV